MSNWSLIVLVAVLSLASLTGGCEPAASPAQRSQPAGTSSAAQASDAAATKEAVDEVTTTSSAFLQRSADADLRVLNYNVNWDHIFPEVKQETADRFARLVRAIDPDIVLLQEVRRSSEVAAALLNTLLPGADGDAPWQVFRGGNNVIASRWQLRDTLAHPTPKGDREIAFALVDLPDERFDVDLYVSNNHYKCCDGERNDPRRQRQSDAIISWWRDARTPGGEIDLPAGTPLIIAGDLNIVGGFGPVETLLTGDIADESAYGPDAPADWDDSTLTDLHPLHNGDGPADYTWRNDGDEWDPGRLDFMIYSDSVLTVTNAFVLNTATMSDEALAEAQLERHDVLLAPPGRFDHLPIVADFRLVRSEE